MARPRDSSPAGPKARSSERLPEVPAADVTAGRIVRRLVVPGPGIPDRQRLGDEQAAALAREHVVRQLLEVPALLDLGAERRHELRLLRTNREVVELERIGV